MESSSGTPHLLTDVRFTVVRKGYDGDEVDNFLERVSAAVAQLQEKLRQATANAEAAEGRAAEASRAQTLLQAKVDKLEEDLATARSQAPAPAVARPPEDDAAEVSKVLVLAQRTADAAVAEARASASQIVTEAEQEASRILDSARTEADETATRQKAELTSEVDSLRADRDQLSGDISALDGYLKDQRASLGGALDRIRAVLDEPGSLRLASPPAAARSARPSAADTVVGSGPAPEAPASDAPTGDASPTPGAEPSSTGSSTATAAAPDETSGRSGDTAVPSEPADPAIPVAPGASATAEAADATAATPASSAPPGPSTPSAPNDGPEASSGSEPGPSGSLFSAGEPSGGAGDQSEGERVAVFDAEAEEAENTFLGRNDDTEADAAMRRFFEADFDDDQRFGR